jgi:hypothetical protein
MKPRTRERRARPSSGINGGTRAAASTCLFVTCVITTGTILLVAAAPCIAAREDTAAESSSALEPPASPCAERDDGLFGIRGDVGQGEGRSFRWAGEETLWIFDADFEDLSGDNLGWLSLDMSGTLEVVNYWHKDTIRINGFEYLGDSTWWCGTYNSCWRQPRGYGNDWLCLLVRELPLSEWSSPGDQVDFEWDQRFAMEKDYDYGYFDVSDDGGSMWTTVDVFNNAGFAGTPGMSCDWDCGIPECEGHQRQQLDAYAGSDILVRFRFESDGAYSSQDQWDNSDHSVLDGAWQLDNFSVSVNDTVRWFDDCESAGSNGWVHDNIPGSGQTGVVFERVFDPDMLRPWSCWPRNHWWMAALDSLTGTMVDGQNSWLISPPIDISGATTLIGQWEAWYDCPRPSEDRIQLWLAAGDSEECVQDPALGFVYSWFLPLDGAYWNRWTDDWSNFAGPDWFVINWRLWNDYPGSYHKTGFMIDRQRVGVPVGGPPTRWDYYVWDRFHDTFVLSEALSDTATIKISDGDGITSARVIVSSDDGQTWDSYPLIREAPESSWWRVPPPTAHIAPATEIRYYFEATDGVGNVRTHPRTAPDAYYEFSVLPIIGSVSEPAILLVDKHGRVTPGEDRRARNMSESFFREALDILGFEYDVFDVNVPSGSILSEGPDTSGMKYYDTQIWFTNEFNAYTLWAFDQRNLIAWLGQSAEGKERNLLLTGNDIGYERMEVGRETLGFYTEWLATEYVQNRPGTYADTMPIVRDVTGGFDFMTFDDRLCHLWDDG